MGGDKITPWRASRVHFGFELDPLVNARLQQAAAEVDDDTRALQALEAAHALDPACLEVLQALYKFHFYRGRLEAAETRVRELLGKAPGQGGFSDNWQELGPDSADWHTARGPARSFLYALKALAFIRLRRDDPRQAREILAVLRRLDPEDQVGAAVIGELLTALEGDHG